MSDPDQVMAELSLLIRDFTEYEIDRLIASGDHEVYAQDATIIRLRPSDECPACRCGYQSVRL